LPGKQIGVATEVIRGAANIGLLTNPRNQGHPVQREGAQAAAAALALKLAVAEAASPKDIDRAFESLVRANSDLVLVLADAVFNRENKRIAVLAAANRLPTMFAFREYVEAGGLMSYGFSLGANWRRGAYYVHRILHGTKPGDLPMELPTKLELVINLTLQGQSGLRSPNRFCCAPTR
jgi:putative ABC transport system substrate-binding protein